MGAGNLLSPHREPFRRFRYTRITFFLRIPANLIIPGIQGGSWNAPGNPEVESLWSDCGLFRPGEQAALEPCPNLFPALIENNPLIPFFSSRKPASRLIFHHNSDDSLPCLLPRQLPLKAKVT